ncbi:MAG: hypothetical protein ACTSRI_01640 [Promethearchaeota archaeon]
MSSKNQLCENCGENIEGDIYACFECGHPICEMCANTCKKCGEYFCDGCFHDHKNNCK